MTPVAKIFRFLSFIILLLPASAFPADSSSDAPVRKMAKIAIIIDDLGYKLKLGRQSIALPHPITLSIIPSSPHAITLAEEANCHLDKEIIVHLPMTPENNPRWEIGLTPQMNEEEFTQAANELVQSIPHAIGVNNHGGSLLTKDDQRMAWLMAVLHEQSLFFIDSRTTALSVAEDAARQASIQFNSRDVFLDNERTPGAIEAQLNKLVELALTHGEAIGIGHPYPETLEVLERLLPKLAEQGVLLVGASNLLNEKQAIAQKTSSAEKEIQRVKEKQAAPLTGESS